MVDQLQWTGHANQIQMILFMKNISIAGGFKDQELKKLLVSAFGGDRRISGNPGQEKLSSTSSTVLSSVPV